MLILHPDRTVETSSCTLQQLGQTGLLTSLHFTLLLGTPGKKSLSLTVPSYCPQTPMPEAPGMKKKFTTRSTEVNSLSKSQLVLLGFVVSVSWLMASVRSQVCSVTRETKDSWLDLKLSSKLDINGDHKNTRIHGLKIQMY